MNGLRASFVQSVVSTMRIFATATQVFIRVVCVLYVANKSSWRICEKQDIKWVCQIDFLLHCQLLPAAQWNGAVHSQYSPPL